MKKGTMLLIVVGLLLLAASFLIGMKVLGLAWWRIPLYVFFTYSFNVWWMSVLSFVCQILCIIGALSFVMGILQLFGKD